jgi:DNA-binding NtrC family response regulator
MWKMLQWLRAGPPERDGAEKGPAILWVSESEAEGALLDRMGASRGWRVTRCRTWKDAIGCLRQDRFAIVLCDRDLAGDEWPRRMEELARSARGGCVILASPVDDEYLWQEVIRHGGYDVVAKPLKEEQLAHAISLAWAYWKAAGNRAAIQSGAE